MLTRLKVDGFKNLDGVDVRFGAFTCIAGANGVGKSNLFDAIAFLSALADKPLAEAAASVRGSEGRVGDVRSLFRNAGGERAKEMSFLVEMIIPASGTDELGAEARASMTFLRYELRLRQREGPHALGPLEVAIEQMEAVNPKDMLRFPNTPAWRDSVKSGRRTVPYIDTIQDHGSTVVRVRPDSEGATGVGPPRGLVAANMPRTVLSTANSAADHRTLVLARKEMLDWTQLQLEPSALRSPDVFDAPSRIGRDGSHLPAALLALTRDVGAREGQPPEDVYQQVGNRLSELFEDVRTLRIDEDQMRGLRSIVLTDRQRSDHRASSLSDGTLRFLALAILEASSAGPSLLCLEEPENGIHPDRIPAMIELLMDIAVDVTQPAGPGNPMRQVIINTHSPGVVSCVPADALVLAEAIERSSDGRSERLLTLRGLPKTWRSEPGDDPSLMPLLGYVSPAASGATESPRRRRVIDREDVRQLALFAPRALPEAS